MFIRVVCLYLNDILTVQLMTNALSPTDTRATYCRAYFYTDYTTDRENTG
jgi:hypothetical protein